MYDDFSPAINFRGKLEDCAECGAARARRARAQLKARDAGRAVAAGIWAQPVAVVHSCRHHVAWTGRRQVGDERARTERRRRRRRLVRAAWEGGCGGRG
jgi:hypothetical protein